MSVQRKSPLDKKRTLRIAPSILSGSLAGVCAVVFTNMPETVKTRMQLDGEATRNGLATRTQYKSLFDAYSKIIRMEGIRGLQGGLGSAIGFQFIMNGIRLGLFDPIQRVVKNITNCSENNLVLKIMSGATSGAMGVAIASPLHLSKNRLQSQSSYFHAVEQYKYKNTFDCLKRVYMEDGFFGLFRGVTAALPGRMVGSAIQLTTYDTVKRLLARKWNVQNDLPAHIVASIVSSLFMVTAINPFDVVSTRIYQSSGKATTYTGVFDCFKKTVHAEGWRALQNGWLALYLRLGPHTILTFVFLEKIRRWFFTIDAFTTTNIDN